MDVGVVGVGAMGRNHVRIYSEFKKVSNLYLFDLDRKAAHALAIKYGATACESVSELLDIVDAVSVCVPTEHHLAVGRQVLAAGVHLLMEKPFCSTVAEAEELIREIRPGTVVGVGHIERFNPIVGEIRRISKEPLYIEINRHNPLSNRIAATSVVHDLMIHDIDVLRHLLPGQPFDLWATGTREIATALFRFGPTAAYLSASRKASKKIRRIYIEEEEFTIEGDYMTQEIYSYWKPDKYQLENERYLQENIIEKVMVNKVEPLKSELGEFLDCARDGRPFPVSPDQALEALKICGMIDKSLVRA